MIGARVVATLQVDGLLFKDLNKNGKLDVYEDWRRPVRRARGRSRRADDDRGEGRPDGRAFAGHGPGRHGARGAGLRRQPLRRRPARARLAGNDGRASRSGTSSSSSTARTPSRARWRRGSTRCRQIAEGRRLGTPVLFVTNPRNHYGGRRDLRHRRSVGRLLAVAAARSASQPRATRRWSRSSRGSPRRSTSPSGSAAPTIRRPTSRPSRAGAASARRSARTRASPPT